MRSNRIRQSLLPVLLALVLVFLLGRFLGQRAMHHEVEKVCTEVEELRADLRARGEFIARLQQEVEYTNAKATWLLRKIDKRRILIPVLNGDVYKIVEVEADFKSEETTDER